MQQTSKKLNFPSWGGEKGYVFAGYKVTIPAQQAIEFVKEEGNYLLLDEECEVGDSDRSVKLSVLNGEVVVKIRYDLHYGHDRDIEIAKTDAKNLLEQIENLLEYAERSPNQKGGDLK